MMVSSMPVEPVSTPSIASVPPSVTDSSSVPTSQQLFLGFDFGTKRTGIATGNRLTCTAEPLQTIRAEGDARFGPIGKLIKDWEPHALVVGVPRYPDGAAHDMTARAEKFARQLRGRFALPVYEVDERYSSVEAESQGKDRIGSQAADKFGSKAAGKFGSQAAKDIDAQSAQIILEQFLRSLV